MTREAAVLVMLAVALVILGLIAWGWWRRVRRDSSIVPPRGELTGAPAPRESFDVLYLATTRVGEPLERLAVRGLGYRSLATLSVTDGGLTLDLTGQQRIPIPSESLHAVGQATVTIDRVVERDGLVCLTWLIADDTLVDSYFRPRDASARAVTDAISDLIPSGETA